MKYIISVSVVLMTLLISCGSRSVEPLQGEIDSLSRHWVPDKRIGICNLSVVNSGGTGIVLKGESMFPGARAEALKLLNGKGISIIDSVVILPDTIHMEKNWGLITLSVANMRSKPAHSSEMVSQAIMGTPVRLLKDGDGWILIQTPDQYIGWTNKSAVHQMTRSELGTWRSSGRIIFTASEGKIFNDFTGKAVISDLVAGTILVKKSETLKGSQVELPDGRIGYVSGIDWKNFNQWKDSISLRSDRIIETGKQFMGFPYLWGGTSSKGMDCSGFVKTVCFLNGVIVERDASQQARHGLEIDLSPGLNNLQKGDLLFFGSKQPYRVNHVGIYVGNGEVLHESGSVHINSLEKNKTNFNEELSSNLVGARRIIGFSTERGYWPLSIHNWY
jgi:gamma-D-glutamyl-L-lysine dipeptidyl-peptidase